MMTVMHHNFLPRVSTSPTKKIEKFQKKKKETGIWNILYTKTVQKHMKNMKMMVSSTNSLFCVFWYYFDNSKF